MGVSKGYDYVIVGGGSAGCVLANRLSEDGAGRVLLIEAGGRDLNPLIHVPLGMGKMHEYDMFNWGYSTEPEPNMNGRRIEAMRGKVLGGSSSINVMAYTRGHRGDYDRWAQKGARGWSYADVLPYFKRCERWEASEDRWRGGAGPVGTEFARTADPLYDAWIQAALAAGFPVTDDYNGKQQEGFGRGQYTIRDGYRSSAARAYLRPARKRPNLEVATRAHATRVLMRGTRASGVEYRKGGRLVRAEAEREVILSAGAFNTPPLLMLSGIGPAAHLREMGIEPVIDLPVGKNLQDHLAVIVFFRRLDESTFIKQMRFDRMAVSMIRAYLFGTGPGTVVPGDKVKSDAEIDAWIRNTAITAHHPCGTCAMGMGPNTVTNPQLRVRGIEHLRVVDASVMPDLISAHINACVLMIAEKAADLIRNKPALPADYDA